MLALLFGAVQRSRGIHVLRSQRITLHPVNGTIRLTRDGERLDAAGTIHAETYARGLLVYVARRVAE